MKKHYSLAFWNIFQNNYLPVIVFFIGLLCGSCYAVGIRTNAIFFYSFHQYTTSDTFQIDIAKLIKNSVLAYGKKTTMLAMCGMFTVTAPIAIGIFFLIAFAYGFTSASFILLYGLKGMLMIVLSLGVQSVLFSLSCLYILNVTKSYRIQKGEKNKSYYLAKLRVPTLCLGLLIGFDVLVQPWLQKLIKLLL